MFPSRQNPAHVGEIICQDSDGGCPTGLLNGGTSGGAPIWAAFQANLNQSAGGDVGFVNPVYYGLNSTLSFHNGASMGSDFAHVGLGSPDLNQIHLQLCGQTAGSPNGTDSQVTALAPFSLAFAGISGVPADGTTAGGIQVKLFDANYNNIGGKNITLASNSTNVKITPASGMTSNSGGTFTFNITDATAENVTFTATDTTDSLVLPQQATLDFVVPPATAASIGATPTSVSADGLAFSTVTVTLKDSLGRPSPGKQIALSQGDGHSNVTGPSPSVTDASGTIQFTVTDKIGETVTYAATDVTDNDLPVPGSAPVTFTGGTSPGCSLGVASPVAGSGFAVSNFATGFISPQANGLCFGPTGMAYDSSGNMYVATYFEGNIYKFGSSGGTASPAQLVTSTPYSSTNCLSGLAFSKDGQHLYMARQFCGQTGSDVVEISPTDGSILREVVTGLSCATGLATDPISGDLFLSAPCPLPVGSNNIFRISNPETSPTVSTYTPPGEPGQASNLAFAPDGTLYTTAYLANINSNFIVSISGTNSASPGTVDYLTNDFEDPSAVLPALNPLNISMPPFVLVNRIDNDMSKVDLTQTPPVTTNVITGGSQGLYGITGPDGCAYMTQSDRILKVTAADGTCNFASSSPRPGLSLSPSTVTPNPTTGSSQTLTATLSNVTSPAGLPIFFQVTGANPQFKLVNASANGQASFTYSALFQGTDTITATSTTSTASLASNQAQITWAAGQDTTFLNLNLSPKGGLVGQSITLVASLSDVSLKPTAPLANQTVSFTLGSSTCQAMTNASGLASCSVTPVTTGIGTLTANFAGTSQYVASSASEGFNALMPTPTPMLTPSPTPTPTPTPKPTPKATPTPTPVGRIGPIYAIPPELDFGECHIKLKGQTREALVFNPWWNNGTANFSSVTIQGSDFSIDSGHSTCKSTLRIGDACTIAIQFTPGSSGDRKGKLIIHDNAWNSPQVVILDGEGEDAGGHHFGPVHH